MKRIAAALILVAGLAGAGWTAGRYAARTPGTPLSYQLVVAPHGDPSVLRLDIPGADRVEIDTAGALVVGVGAHVAGPLRPHAYQRVDGMRRDVGVRFVIAQDGFIAFAFGPYDPARALVVEPPHSLTK